MTSLASSKADDFIINAMRPDQDRKILRKENGVTSKGQKFYLSIDEQFTLRMCIENDRRLADRVEYFRIGRYGSIEAARTVFDNEFKVLLEARESPYERPWFNPTQSYESKKGHGGGGQQVDEHDRVRVTLSAAKFGQNYEKHVKRGDHVTVRSNYVQIGPVSLYVDSLEAVCVDGGEFVYSDGGQVKKGKWSELIAGDKFEVDIWIYHFQVRTKDEVVQYALDWYEKSKSKAHLNNCQTFAQRCHSKKIYTAGQKINCKVYSIN